MADVGAAAPPKALTTLDVTIPLEQAGIPLRGILKQPQKPDRVMYFSPASLARVLMDLKQEDSTDLNTWWDLLGATGYAARRTGTKEEIVMTTPAGVRDIRYGAYRGEDRLESSKYKPYKVHLPALVWILTFQSQKLQSGKLFCSERLVNSLDENAKLTVFPYAHGNDGSGLICWGGVSINHITPKDPRLAERVFFASGTNHHLFNAPWLGMDLGRWLEAHQSPADLEVQIPLPWKDVHKTTLKAALGNRDD